jgi:hypothetical protein
MGRAQDVASIRVARRSIRLARSKPNRHQGSATWTPLMVVITGPGATRVGRKLQQWQRPGLHFRIDGRGICQPLLTGGTR